MSVRVFVTGGTFDKEYDERTGRLFFRNTHVDEMLRRGRCGLAVDVETLMMVDSLDMSEGQRATIVRACRGQDRRAHRRHGAVCVRKNRDASVFERISGRGEM